MTVNATIEALSAGGSIGNANHSGSAHNPGYPSGGSGEIHYDYFDVGRGDLVDGNQLEVNMTANATAVVNVCSPLYGAGFGIAATSAAVDSRSVSRAARSR